ncbi:hypothetical protein [Natronorubrum halophilum]|uniref:hypothetical protein n=1 Tax=Natronorubrum halophilum TaxID=1702106 RepID=UPI0013CE61E0|nr:hypothetical protein [Natronorubrum halophilum]
MSESPAADAVVISQRALGKCVFLEDELNDLQAETDEIEARIEHLEGDLHG